MVYYACRSTATGAHRIWGQSRDWVAGVDAEAREWIEDAACQGTDPEMFFYAEAPDDRHFLKHLCGGCPVRLDCLEEAIRNREDGWWGGMTKKERATIVRRRHREASYRESA